MKNQRICRLSFCLFAALFFTPLLSAKKANAEEITFQEKEVYVGGMTAGFLLKPQGVKIVGFVGVNGSENDSPAKKASVKVGDSILELNGVKLNGTKDLTLALQRSGGKEVELLLLRGEEKVKVNLTPASDGKGNYKIGVLVKDSVSGIGTVSYIEKDSLRFASLGHAVLDENGVSLSLADDKVYACSVVGVNKGVRGKAGELKGLFLSDKQIATATTVLDTGIYGEFSPEYDFSALKTVTTAGVNEAHVGKAIIYSTVSGTQPKEYEASIVKVDQKNKENKNFVIKITDEELIQETGGIVQGMSGSPILQDGKMIGAVTHVFLNDPTRGYGISMNELAGK